MRTKILAGFAVIAMLLLAGCFKVDMNLTVNADDTVDGVMIVALDKSLAEMDDEADASEMFEQGDLPEGAKIEKYEDDTMVGQKVTFTGVPLEEFNSSMNEEEDSEDALTLIREGDKYIFKGGYDPSDMSDGAGGDDANSDVDDFGMGEEFDAEMEEMMKNAFKDAEFRIAITFPGKVIETNGKVDGKTVTWDLDPTEKSTMKATAEVPSAAEKVVDTVTGKNASGFPIVPVAIGAGLLALVAGGGFFLLRKGKSTSL